MKKIPCSVEILTRNSAATLVQCLESIKDFDDIIVLDGNSTDGTVDIAKQYGARVFPQKETVEKNIIIDDFAAIRNKGLQKAKYRWFLYIDSDEYLSRESIAEIQAIVSSSETPYYGVYRLPRKFVVEGSVIERASTYPNYQPRLFYLPCIRGFAKSIHETMKIKPGTRTGTLQFPEYVPLDTIDITKKKWKRYLDIQQKRLFPITGIRMLKGLRSNIQKCFIYSVKYLLLSFQGNGKKMPFVYEFYNVAYHVSLMGRLVKNYAKSRKINKK